MSVSDEEAHHRYVYKFKIIVSKVQHPSALPSLELLGLFQECEHMANL